ncbi:MAG: iron ABC transporter permease [Rhodospirillaceae bacterium]|nr:iron ABC transporter permease [Rhodospirillaceae bacterium]OUU13397.1 MAG: iron ABC transporter permease [Candidatus Endolissoclinum sp. TMED37]
MTETLILRPTKPKNTSLARILRTEQTWPKTSVLLSLFVLLPVTGLLWAAVGTDENIWQHLLDSVLPNYIVNSLILMTGVCLGVTLVGTCTAWLIANCRFPGHKVFGWMLILPLAMPAYVMAYVYTDFLEYSGPLQTALRLIFSWENSNEYWFPEVRSHGGAIILLSLVLYPYVYALARAAFSSQALSLLEAGRMLGHSPMKVFFSVSLPLARPAIVVGVTLALMETLSDFGTVDYFAVRTLTTGIFDVWFGMENQSGAAQIALVLLTFIILLVWLERTSRKKQRVNANSRINSTLRLELKGWRSALAIICCGLPILFGFLLPAIILAIYSSYSFNLFKYADYLTYTGNTLFLATGTAVLCMMLGIFIGYSQRLSSHWSVKLATRISTIGYAIPGAALAIGLIISFGAMNEVIIPLSEHFSLSAQSFFLSGGVVALFFAYTIRFLAISVGSVESGLEKITPNMDMASRTLGSGPFSTLCRIHIPLLRPALIAGSILVFVDTMKELPATLILRPFNFETLATFVYQYASDELLVECAPAALTIVLAGILPVILLNAAVDKKT